MAARVLLATPSPEIRDHLTHVITESDGFELAGAAVDGAGLLTAIERQPYVAVVVIDASVDGGHGHDVVRRVGIASPLSGIVLLVDQAGPDELVAAMDVGARSVISRNAGLDEVVSRFEAVARWSSAAQAAVSTDRTGGRGGNVVAIAGAKGGVGASALTLLLARAGRRRGSATVVDLDLGKGDLAAYAGVGTRRSVVDLALVEGEITGRMLRETTYEIAGGLRLLPAPGEGERGEDMTPGAARAVVSALRFESDLAVIDVGSHLDEPRATVLELADRALLVTTPDMPSLRAARRTVAQWERLGIRPPSEVELVLNRRTSRDQVTRQLVERVVERPVAFTVPDGGEPFATAVNTATLLEANTSAHQALAEVAAPARPDPGRVAPAERDGESEVEALLSGSARRVRRRDLEAGQASVELPVVVVLCLLVLLLCIQGIGWATGMVFARAAAQEGARTVGVAGAYDSSVAAAAAADARDTVPDAWRAGTDVSVSADTVRVRLTSPTLIPGIDLTAESSAAVYQER